MCNGKGDQLGPFRFSGFRSSLKPNQTAVIGAGEWVENLFNPFQHLSFCFHRVGESNPRSEDKIEHPTGSTAWGETRVGVEVEVVVGFPPFLSPVVALVPQPLCQLVGWFCHKKAPAERRHRHRLGRRFRSPSPWRLFRAQEPDRYGRRRRCSEWRSRGL